VLRIGTTFDSQRTAQLGRRSSARAEFQSVGAMRLLPPKATAFHAWEIERQEHDWWVLVDGDLVGTLSLEPRSSLPQLGLVAERGAAWFASLIGVELTEN
jgi:hypothetical protein